MRTSQKFASGSYEDIHVVSCGQDEHCCTVFRALEGAYQGKVVSLPVHVEAGQRTHISFAVPPYNRPVKQWSFSRPDTERPSGGPIPRPDEQEPEAPRYKSDEAMWRFVNSRPVPPPQASPPSWAADMLATLGDIRDSLDAIAGAIRDSRKPSPRETTAEPTPEPVKFPTPWSFTPQQVETYLLDRGWLRGNEHPNRLSFSRPADGDILVVHVPRNMSAANFRDRMNYAISTIATSEGRTCDQVKRDIAAIIVEPEPADIAATIKPTAEQVEKYLRASGWEFRYNEEGVWAYYLREHKMITVYQGEPSEKQREHMAVTLHMLAEHEGRELDQVKWDIAAIIVEPEPAAPTLPEPEPVTCPGPGNIARRLLALPLRDQIDIAKTLGVSDGLLELDDQPMCEELIKRVTNTGQIKNLVAAVTAHEALAKLGGA